MRTQSYDTDQVSCMTKHHACTRTRKQFINSTTILIRYKPLSVYIYSEMSTVEPTNVHMGKPNCPDYIMMFYFQNPGLYSLPTHNNNTVPHYVYIIPTYIYYVFYLAIILLGVQLVWQRKR